MVFLRPSKRLRILFLVIFGPTEHLCHLLETFGWRHFVTNIRSRRVKRMKSSTASEGPFLPEATARVALSIWILAGGPNPLPGGWKDVLRGFVLSL